MNDQYNKFKESSKKNKNKSEKFMNFYEKCKENRDNGDENAEVCLSVESVTDIKSLAKKKELIQKCYKILPEELPDGVESVKSSDIISDNKYIDMHELVKVWYFI